MKKILKGTIVLMMLLFITVGCSCEKRTENMNDNERFKKEFESLNGKLHEQENPLQTLSIAKDNPIVYKTDQELVEMIKNKETFVVFFGYKDCLWCRCMIPSLLDMAKELNLDKIYYVDIEEIRDTLEVDADGTIVEKEKGTEAYKEILSLFENVLTDYSLLTPDKEAISAGEKRIYAPTVVSVKEGIAIRSTDGVSDTLEDAFSEITEEQKQEMDEKLKGVMEEIATN